MTRYGKVEAVAASVSGRTGSGLVDIRIVFNLSSPGIALEDMPQSSVDRCEWHCSAEGLGHQ
ncbi:MULTISPECIES: hypothetical protein [Streptomyces]|uniref:Uncharacterized protein n=1 Tax=Streptomyces mangrovi TaxID=1206892 RepID=A0ABV9IRJ7_9ACTN